MKQVAIIGAGPTGRAAARALAEAGATVTVLEKEAEAGGLMRYGYPAFRLPSRIPERDTRSLIELGVDFQFNVALGQDVTLDELERDYDAVLIATGAPVQRELGIPGEELANVWHSLDFLYALRTGQPIEVGKRMVVIGGGDTAMDVAVSAHKLKMKEVTVCYRNSIRALPHEIKRAERNGAEFRGNLTAVRIDHGSHGLTVSFQDNSSLEVDTVVIAIGQEQDSAFIKHLGLTVHADGTTDRPKVFLAGGTRYGSDRLAKAIQDGRRAAELILPR